jgi:nicotinamide-nucleotide amidase
MNSELRERQCLLLKEALLREPKLTISSAESLTAGRVQSLLSACSGSSAFFLGGLTAYNLEQKVRHLQVDRQVATSCNCVSALVAEQMAQGACALFGSDIGIATTGYAEPSPAEDVKDPFAWCALAYRTKGGVFAITRSWLVLCTGLSRTEAQQAVADFILGETLNFAEAVRTVPAHLSS